MILPVALALMAGAGYNSYRRGEEADARRAKMAADADEDRQYVQKERQRVASMRDAIAAAGAPRQVEDGTTYQPAVDDDGNQMPANPTAGTFKANGQRYATMAEANAAAAAANNPLAQAKRVSDAYMQHGEYGQAAQVLSGARQAELGELQLNEAREGAQRSAALREAAGTIARGGWSGVPKVYERYNDGNSVSVVEDGKGGATLNFTDKDGNPIGSKAYPSQVEFIADLDAHFDPKRWMERNDRQTEAARKQANADREYGLKAANETLVPDGAGGYRVNQPLLDAKTQVARAGASSVSVSTGQKGYENESKLRNDFRSEPIYKDFQDMKSAYSQIKVGLKQANPVGDLAAATKIMKLLDPGSVVRESELGMAMASTGRMDKLQNYVQMQISGEKLTPKQREEFGRLADELMAAATQAYNTKRAEYEKFGKGYGLNTEVLGAAAPVAQTGPASGRPTELPGADAINAELARRGVK